MFEVNVKKLKGKISECGYNNTTLSKACGINRNTLTTYLKQPDKMPYRIIVIMANLLCEDSNEAELIFFATKLTRNES